MPAVLAPRVSRSEIVERSKRLLHREISFIHSPLFPKMRLEDVEWKIGEIYVDESSDVSSNDRIVPTHLSYLFRKPLLTPAGELHLFRRMNYLRFLANRKRAKIDPQQPRVKLVREVEKLVAESELARKQLLESNLRLVASIARKFAKSMADFEDLLSEGNGILLYAIDKFDFSRGFRFSTYATHAIQRHYFRVIQRMQRKRRIEVDCPSDMLMESVKAPESEPQPSAPTLTSDMLKQMAKLLDQRELRIIQERFGLRAKPAEDKTLKVLSDEMGLSKERVRQLQHRALGKLRVYLENHGVTLDDCEA
ncbi:MAG: sigma-70 family RNA polymerase sigma factor [Planctomycetaceae bacterium]